MGSLLQNIPGNFWDFSKIITVIVSQYEIFTATFEIYTFKTPKNGLKIGRNAAER